MNVMPEWSLEVNKQDLAERFGKAASIYDQYALLQQQVGHTLIELLPDSVFAQGMDLGCGTGFFLPQLAARCQRLLAVDLATGMLRQAMKRDGAAYFICGDAEQLPLMGQSLDLVYSTLALQWCEQLPVALAEIYRVLRPGGFFAFSTLTEGSLSELRSAWRDVDHQDHVNPFITRDTLQYLCDDCGFRSLVWQEHHHVLHYATLRDLLMSLKGIGANQVTGRKSSGLAGRNRLHLLEMAYQKMQSSSGELPLSYEVCYGVLMR